LLRREAAVRKHVWTELERSLLPRVVLVAVFVIICHLFEWRWLRLFTTDTLVSLSAVLGLPMRRLDWDLISIGAIRVQFVVSCSLVDAFLGAVPLLWRTSRSFLWNLLRLAVYVPGLFCLNIFRLEIGFVGIYFGMPWWLAHECVSGVTYFGMFLWIVHDWRKFESRAVLPDEPSACIAASRT
jgi:hypothetical protein